LGTNKRLLVTGLGGFIGRRTIPLLIDKGYEIHAVGRSAKPEYIDDKVNWVRLDLCNLELTTAHVRSIRPTHLLNLAWFTEHGHYWNSPENSNWVRASLNLQIAFSECQGKRFVGAGTCAEYDWDYGFMSESLTPKKSRTPFGRSKNALYEASSSLADTTDTSFAWGRVFFVYGPHESEKRLVASVITSLLAGNIAKCSHGNQIRDFSHSDDIAAAFVALLESDVTGAVNIASGNPVPVKTIVNIIAEKIGRPELIELGVVKVPEDDPPLIAADVRRLRNEVGIQPIYDLDSGLQSAIDFYRGYD